MLILTRRPGERVAIGEDILVTVMEISGNLVRLGFAAPDGISIYREEIWEAVKEENRAAASGIEELPSAGELPLPPDDDPPGVPTDPSGPPPVDAANSGPGLDPTT